MTAADGVTAAGSVPAGDLPAADPRRLPAGRRRRGGRLPGRPRGDPRLLLAPAALGGGQHPRLRHRRPRAHRRGRAAGGPGFDRFVAAAARARARPGARPGAQPHGRRRPGGRAVVVGRAAARAATARTPAAFDIDWEFGGGKVRIPVLGSADDVEPELGRSVDGELRYYDNRFPLAPGTGAGHAAGGARPAALRAGRLASRRRRPELPPVLRDQHPRRAAGRGPGGLRRDPRAGAASWCATAPSTALRIDHPDGLADPKGYLDRLAEASGGRWTRGGEDPGARRGRCPSGWATAGTTGYDALAEVDRVLVDPAGEAGADRAGHRAGRRRRSTTRELVARQQARGHRRRCSARRWPGWSGSSASCRASTPRAADRGAGRAAGQLRRSTAATCPTAASTSTRRWPRVARAPARPGRRPLDALHPVLAQAGTEAATRFEQTSGPVMAKGVEDTAFYRWARFVALNEVGGDPAGFGSAVARVPRRAAAPAPSAGRTSMTTLSTHDTKRSEDVRARLAVLAELPERVGRGWCAAADAATRWPTGRWRTWSGRTLVGAWPLVAGAAARLRREGRPRGRHLDRPGPTRTRRSRSSCTRSSTPRFDDAATRRRIVDAFVDRIAPRAGRTRSRRSCCSSRCPACPTSTRAPSCGTSRWSTRTTGARSTSRCGGGCSAGARRRRAAGGRRRPARPSCSSTSRALRLRRDQPELFTGYAPVAATGPAADHVVAFDRGGAVDASRPGCRSAWPPRRLGRHRAAAAHRPWRDLLTGRRTGACRLAEPASADLLGRAVRSRLLDRRVRDASTSGRRCPSGCGSRSTATSTT